MNVEKMIAAGLTKNEAKLYLAALQLGTSSITHLAQTAKLKRPTAYNVLEDLLTINLLTKVPHGKTIHYSANDPVLLIKEIETIRTTAIKLLPELTSLYKNNSKKVLIEINSQKTNSIQSPHTAETKKRSGIFSVNMFFRSFTKKN
ncbi:MAG TPA: helix-turn-helix domain-containing protein [bacterium]|nr:helix-turn-helix domain-containing protein [bacterium]